MPRHLKTTMIRIVAAVELLRDSYDVSLRGFFEVFDDFLYFAAALSLVDAPQVLSYSSRFRFFPLAHDWVTCLIRR